MIDSMAPPQNESELEERLSRPTPGSIEAMGRLEGDLLILGAGGKMGPSLARMARRAADAAGRTEQRVVAVSRFSDPRLRGELERERIATIACDLLDPRQRAALPPASDVIWMVGQKFGTGLPGSYWATNTLLAGALAEQYAGARIVAFSTGNVYAPTPRDAAAPRESTPAAPLGEYAMSCWGRERVLQYMSHRHGTPTLILRLNYAVEMRYGVLVDLAGRLLRGESISLAVPEVNLVWQGYANAVAIESLARATSPAEVLNVTGPGRHRVRDLATALAARLGVDAHFIEPEGTSSLLSDASACRERFGEPLPDTQTLLDWTAAWLAAGGRTLDRPTKFDVTDGDYAG